MNLGKTSHTYIIAEMSCNHNHNIQNAIKLIHEAKRVGADAVKLQTYTPDTITIDCNNPYFQIKGGTLWDNETLYSLYSKAYTPWDWHKTLVEEANKIGIDIFSSPFDLTAVDFLESLNMPCYKVASFEVTDHILLKRIGQTEKPVIMSTGITELDEIFEAVNILKSNGTPKIYILKCTSAYPAPIDDANLATIPNMAQTFNTDVGLSDHTQGIEVPIAAVCLGAKIIEKHFTLDKNSGSPDDAFSLEPDEFEQMVKSIRKVEKAIGTVQYKKSTAEKKSNIFKRSLFITQDMKKGDKFTPDNIKSIRPGYGLHTRYYDLVLSSIAKQDLVRGIPLSWEHIDKRKTILLLSDSSNLFDFLNNKQYNIIQKMDKINITDTQNIDFIISYGYRHIIPKDIINKFINRIINLHISYLPWNKGAHPNFWSFIDNTPKGVSIHYMDVGLDTGDIIAQREMFFDIKKETFSSTYHKLKEEIEELFYEYWDDIVNERCPRIKQKEKGTYHKMKDLTYTVSWDTNIDEFLSNI